jgi:hypothetical protein
MPRMHASKLDPLDLKGTHLQTREIPHQPILPSAKTTATKHYFFVKFLAHTLEESRNSKRTFPRFREAAGVHSHLFMIFQANVSPHRRGNAPHPTRHSPHFASAGRSPLGMLADSPRMRLRLRRLRIRALLLLPIHLLRLYFFGVRGACGHEWTAPRQGNRERQCAQGQAGCNVALERFERLHGEGFSIKKLYLLSNDSDGNSRVPGCRGLLIGAANLFAFQHRRALIFIDVRPPWGARSQSRIEPRSE